MANSCLISVFCQDRVGLISALTGRLFDLGGNLGDTTFAVLGEGAEFTSVCDLPTEVSLDEIKAELAQLPALSGASIDVRPFEFEPGPVPQAQITHLVECEGGDRPGLIARLTEIFNDFDTNIVRMNADKQTRNGEDIYLIRFAVRIPKDRSAACLATIANTAGELRQIFRWQETQEGL